MSPVVSESVSTTTLTESSRVSSSLSILNNTISNTTDTTSTSALHPTSEQDTSRSKPRPIANTNQHSVPLATDATASSTEKRITTKSRSKPFRIRPAVPADAKQIAHLGAETFAASFGFSIPSVDLKKYLDEAYAVDVIERELTESDKTFFVVVDASPSPDDEEAKHNHPAPSDEDASNTTSNSDPQPTDQILAFSMLTTYTGPSSYNIFPPPTPTLPSPISSSSSTHQPTPQGTISLQRIYVHPTNHNTGIGSTLLTHTLSHARSLGYENITLGVWEGNFIAQKVYERYGFQRVGEMEFVMGRCVQIDWVMWKEL
jgi:ribosomal protein S18 acetylase RimI-like enzyme